MCPVATKLQHGFGRSRPTPTLSPPAAACASAITYIDGDAGHLLYRGYPIEALAQRGDFVDAAYALLQGDLPTKARERLDGTRRPLASAMADRA